MLETDDVNTKLQQTIDLPYPASPENSLCVCVRARARARVCVWICSGGGCLIAVVKETGGGGGGQAENPENNCDSQCNLIGIGH